MINFLSSHIFVLSFLEGIICMQISIDIAYIITCEYHKTWLSQLSNY